MVKNGWKHNNKQKRRKEGVADLSWLLGIEMVDGSEKNDICE